MNLTSKIAVFGASGLIGSALINALKFAGYKNIIPCLHSEVDLVDQADVNLFFAKNKLEYVFFCAHKNVYNFDSGKIIDAEEAYSNIMMLCNVMEASRKYNIKKAVFVGSAMIYPWGTNRSTPFTEDMTEEYRYLSYKESMRSTALSKFVGLKLCQYYHIQYGCNFVYALPTHIYGSLANRKNLYFLEKLVVDIAEAKKQNRPEIYLDIYGRGIAKKQFLHTSDCASALIIIMEKCNDYTTPINVSSNKPTSWQEIVGIICDLVKYNGKVYFESSHSENLDNRIVSIEKLEKLGWKQKIAIRDGLSNLCKEYLERGDM